MSRIYSRGICVLLPVLLAACGCSGLHGGKSASIKSSSSASPDMNNRGSVRHSVVTPAAAPFPGSDLTAIGFGPGNYPDPEFVPAGASGLQPAPWLMAQGAEYGIYPSITYEHALLSGAGRVDYIVGESGGKTILSGVSGLLISVMFSPDEKWFGVNITNSIKIFKVTAGISHAQTVRIPSSMTSGSAKLFPSLVGFTTGDKLIISLGAALWVVSRNGSAASRLVVRDVDCCYQPTPPDNLYTTSPQGLVAVISRKPNADGGSDATDLLNGSGSVIHQFPGGDPLSFSPDGRYLVIDLIDDSTNPDAPVPEEACSTRAFTCVALPGMVTPEWLPGGDLALFPNIDVAGLGLKWWNVGTRTYASVPPVFKQLTAINYVLPARLTAAVKSTLEVRYAASRG